MKKRVEYKQIYSLFLRYLILIVLGLGNLWIFYFVFTPITIYPIYFFLHTFFSATLSGTTLLFNNYPIIIAEACIAGSAYYLLTILNLSTPISFAKRVYSLAFSYLTFLIINIIRIIIFSILFVNSFSLFNTLHLLFWYFLSGVIVFLIWYATIKLFKIKEIPVYTDIKYIYSLTRK